MKFFQFELLNPEETGKLGEFREGIPISPFGSIVVGTKDCGLRPRVISIDEVIPPIIRDGRVISGEIGKGPLGLTIFGKEVWEPSLDSEVAVLFSSENNGVIRSYNPNPGEVCPSHKGNATPLARGYAFHRDGEDNLVSMWHEVIFIMGKGDSVIIKPANVHYMRWMVAEITGEDLIPSLRLADASDGCKKTIMNNPLALMVEEEVSSAFV